uniref:Uncharacterized protein n=1 Tax=Mimivirus LCMiAC01 TaxID=2506608 RepID=A0A481Z159_9VIRU|nr:MAG: hypothetical protein LCMiAC01_04970 [Mimivirus LCMiAC01]
MSESNDMFVPKVIVYKNNNCPKNIFKQLNQCLDLMNHQKKNISIEQQEYFHGIDYDASLVVLEYDGDCSYTDDINQYKNILKQYLAIDVMFVLCTHHSHNRYKTLIVDDLPSYFSNKYKGSALTFDANNSSVVEATADFILSFANKNVLTKETLKKRLMMKISDMESKIIEMTKLVKDTKLRVKKL